MKKILIAMLCLGLIGCVTASHFEKITIGMSKEELIKNIGKPNHTILKEGSEYLEYRGGGMEDGHCVLFPIIYKVKNGVVESIDNKGLMLNKVKS